MFKSKLSDLLTDSNEHNVLWRALLEAVNDHGGDIDHLNHLLADAKVEGRLVDELAKLIVGDIWKFVAEPVDMGLSMDDFHCSNADFVSRYPGIVLPYTNSFTESKPAGPCRYVLHHSRAPMLFSEIIGKSNLPRSNYEHAGWRELAVYVSRLSSADMCGCDIIAAGSRVIPVQGGERGQDHAFPRARAYVTDSVSLGWKGVERPDVERFGVKCFYLVRSYNYS